MVTAPPVDVAGCGIDFNSNQAFVTESWVSLRGLEHLKLAMNFTTFSMRVHRRWSSPK
jgi:hypothetical protein